MSEVRTAVGTQVCDAVARPPGRMQEYPTRYVCWSPSSCSFRRFFYLCSASCLVRVFKPEQ